MPSFFPELTRGARATAVAFAAVVASALPQAHAARVSGQGTWETTLQGRDLDGDASTFEAYYDTALDITWLADANYAFASGYTSAVNGGVGPWTVLGNNVKWTDGSMGWDAAMAWAAELNVNGITGWRLPAMVDTGAPGCDWSYGGTDCGYNVDTSTSELAHMYHITLGNNSYRDASGNYNPSWGLSNMGPFSNIQSGASYWSGVENAIVTTSAWSFSTYDVRQDDGVGKAIGLPAWAVRSGDIAAVPEPQTYALALAGLVTVLAARRRRHG